MAVSGDTGNLATISFAANMGFGTATTSVICTEIEPGGWTRGGIDASDLGTTGFEKSIPGDLAKAKSAKIKFKWLTKPTTEAMYADPATAAPGSVVQTWPMRSGETTAATYTGTAFVTDMTLPKFANGELQLGEMELQYDGDTGPAYVKAA